MILGLYFFQLNFHQNVLIFLLVQNRVISNNTLSTFLRLVKVARMIFFFSNPVSNKVKVENVLNSALMNIP